MCDNEIISEALSPDKTRRVVVFQRGCGATTGFNTQVSVLLTGRRLPNTEGNLFIGDTDHGAAPASLNGGPRVRVKWEDAHSLTITHHPKVRIFKSEPVIDGVQVKYVTLQ
jgi:hypothetical protein